MSGARKRRSEWMRRRSDYIVEQIAGEVICARCGAMLLTYDNDCTAELIERCPGFECIEAVMAKFAEDNPL